MYGLFEITLQLIRLMGNDFDWVALTEVDDTVRNEILESIPNEQIADPNARSLQITQDGDWTLHLVGHGAHDANGLAMLLVRAV